MRVFILALMIAGSMGQAEMKGETVTLDAPAKSGPLYEWSQKSSDVYCKPLLKDPNNLSDLSIYNTCKDYEINRIKLGIPGAYDHCKDVKNVENNLGCVTTILAAHATNRRFILDVCGGFTSDFHDHEKFKNCVNKIEMMPNQIKGSFCSHVPAFNTDDCMHGETEQIWADIPTASKTCNPGANVDLDCLGKALKKMYDARIDKALHRTH